MQNVDITKFYFLRISSLWGYFKSEHFSFWMICCYLFFEYTRPQAIFPIIDFLPWAQLFLLGALVGAFSDKTVAWVPSIVTVVLCIFALVIFMSSQLAYYPEVSKKHYIDFYSWFVVYFLIVAIVNTRSRYYVFVIIFLLCAAKISFGTSKAWVMRGFAFTGWGLMGPKGYFQNSGELAILMLTLFPVAFYIFSYLKDKVTKIEFVLLVLFWLTPVMTIMGASSRGSQIALAAQLIVMFRKSLFRPKALFGVLAFVFILFNILPEEQKNRFETAGEDKTSQQRLLYWENGWEMIKDHPFTGVGYFNFPPYYADHYPEDMLYEHAELPHNIFIQVGTDAGFTGLIPFVFLCFYPLIYTRFLLKHKEREPFLVLSLVGVAYGIFGFVLAGQFVTVAYYPFLWLGLAFFVSGNNVLKKCLKTAS